MSKQLEEGLELALDWNKLEKAVAGTKGIIPVAVQNADTKEVILVAYINQLEIESEEKDLMKIQALEEFPTTRQAYARSCREILEVYQLAKKEGYTFGFREVRFHPTDQRGNIGFLEVVYTAQFGKESTTDGLRVEIILTPNGWKIIDGF